MRDSIIYSAVRALAVAFCVVIGLCLGFIFISFIIGSLSTGSTDSRLTTVNTEEILPNAEGKREALTKETPVILQINVEGIIGMDQLDTKSIRQLLVESREGDFKNDRVKAILLYINTPGGTVSDADGIFNALLSYKKKYQIPIYAYVDGLCASGGMYVAMAADKIFSSDTSLIGSIGVIAPSFMNFTKLLEKVGVETLTISAGKDKDALNPLRPWKPNEDQNYRHIIEYYYEHFVNLITTYRPKISKDDLINEYGAKIFPAPLAQEYGFIDVSKASLSTALTELLEVANVTGKYQVIQLENKGWWKTLFSSYFSSLFGGRLERFSSYFFQTDLLMGNQFLYLYQP